MMKSMVFVVVALAGAVAWDLSLSRSEGALRASTMRVGRFAKLGKPEHRKADTATRIVVTASSGQKWEYVKEADGWRCPSYNSAPASEEKIKSVITKAFEAEGIIQTFDPARHGEFGLGKGSGFQLDAKGIYREDRTPKSDNPFAGMAGDSSPKVWGPDEPWEFAWDVGNATIDREGSFVRRRGENAVWHVDQNSHMELDPTPGSKLPPLLDGAIVPMSWLQSAKQIRRVTVQIDGGDQYELELREKQITPDEMKQGKSPFEWWLKDQKKFPPGPSAAFLNPPPRTMPDPKASPESKPAEPVVGAVAEDGYAVTEHQQSLSFTSFVMRAPMTDVLAEAQHKSLGFDKSRAKISLVPMEGEPCDLYVSYQGGSKAAVYNTALRTAYEIDAAVVELLAPSIAQLMQAGAQGMPWRPWLQQMR